MKNLTENVQNCFKRLKEKAMSQSGSVDWVAIGIMVLIVVVIGSTIILPRFKKTAEKQFDNVDERLEDVFNYK